MIIRVARRKRYTVISNIAIEDDLSLEALGLLIYLLSKPDNWSVSAESLAKQRNCCDKKIRRLLTELEAKRYFVRTRTWSAETKGFQWEQYVYEEPTTNPVESAGLESAQSAPNQPGRSYLVGNRRISYSSSSKKNTELKTDKTNTDTKDGAGAFEAFYEAFPRHLGRIPALKAFLRLSKEERIEAMSDVLERNLKGWGCETRYIPHPATYLNQKRWEDEEEEAPPPKAQPQRSSLPRYYNYVRDYDDPNDFA